MTPRQQQALDFIVAFQQANPGAAPTLAQLKDGLGLASRGTAHGLLRKLEEAGCIRRPDKRTLEVVSLQQAEAPPPAEKFAEVPV